MGSPRLDVVFCFWQCDKKNHGWREGPPVTVLCQSFRSAGRAFTLRLNQFRTKKEYSFTLLPASLSLKHWLVIVDHPDASSSPLVGRRPMGHSLESGQIYRANLLQGAGIRLHTNFSALPSSSLLALRSSRIVSRHP